jgi:CBS domain-containing protein/rhodanese-related sulfurtransferase
MQTISKNKLQEFINGDNEKKYTLIDVMPEDSFQQKHIKSAVNVPYHDNDRFIEDVHKEIGSNEDILIFYCKNEDCPLSEKASKALEETGYDNVYDFEGGLEEWFGKDQMEQAEVSNNQKSRKVKDIMSENVDYIEPDTSLKEVAKKMTDSGTGSFAIGNGDKLVGFITDRDIVTRAVAEGKDINETKVKEIMTENVLYCFENDSLEEIADNMKNNEVLRLIVLDKDKNFVGMVTHSDLSKAISDKDDKLNNKVAELASFREAA